MKANKLYPIGIIILSVIFLNSFNKNSDFIQYLKNRLSAYEEHIPDERVYLQFDKPIYKPGDIIWFSAWLVSGAENKPVSSNEIVFVELLDPKGSVVREFNLYTANGKAYGDLQIDYNMPGGLYKVRAYTEWLKTLGQEYFFTKDIPVQKYIKPNMLLKLDFEKEAYGPGDNVCATFKARDLEDIPVAFEEISFKVQLGGKSFLSSKSTTNSEGETVICFQLPDTLNSNDGLLNVMVNYHNKSESVSRSIPIVLNNINLQFFPEGGNLVAEINSVVAFKALNEFGKPADIAGVIIDEKEHIVQEFSSYHDGMGAFQLQPKKDMKYKALITRPEGIDKEFPLTEILSSDYVLNVTNKTDKEIELLINSPKSGIISLVAQMGSTIYFSQQLSVKKGTRNFSFSTIDFPCGIVRITLFGTDQKPVCERLVFVNKHQNLNVNISTNKTKYSPREKVEMEIETRDNHGKPVPASISLAVVNDKVISLADDKQDNILSSLLLSSGVREEVHEPSFYFDPDEEKAEKALDYLLMTQGWRRYGWIDVVKEEYENSKKPAETDVVTGQVIYRPENKGIKANLKVIQWGNIHKGMEFETDKNGRFAIVGADPMASLTIYAYVKGARRGQVYINIEKTNGSVNRWIVNATDENKNVIPEILQPKVTESVKEPASSEKPEIISDNMSANLSLTEDLQSLDEVVVVGYGTAKKSDVTGSVAYVQSEEIISLTSLENALKGKVSGVVVLDNSGNPGNPSDIKIRGLASVTNTSPLYVIDGIPYYPANSGTISALAHVSAEDIDAISILKGPDADRYGYAGSNGVVLITTKKEQPRNQPFITRGFDASYYIHPRKTRSWGRQFYSPVYNNVYQPKDRTDFRETIYWKPDIKTDAKGKAKLTFYSSDEITTFRAIAEGMNDWGLIGRNEHTFHTQKPLNLDMKVPAFVSTTDTVRLKVLIRNNTSRNQKGTLICEHPGHLRLLKVIDSTLIVGPDQTLVYEIPFIATRESGNQWITLKFKAGIHTDKVSRRFEVFKTGFPVETSLAGDEINKYFEFDLNNPVEGSLNAEFKAYPSLIYNLLDGIESIIRAPYGCFEQTSSSTYPNIMVLQFLRQTGADNSAIRQRALKYIDQGYHRLKNFEVKGGGFDWFGRPPAHLGLTAYGLMEFTEMQGVYPFVDEKMINRTKNWIMSKRDRKGNFINELGKYSFSGGSQETLNAYIIFALSESGTNYEAIKPEYDKAISDARISNDAYRVALMANAAYNLGKINHGEELVKKLIAQIKYKKPGNLEVNSTLTYSWGKSAQVEATAFVLLAMLKSDLADEGLEKIMVRYIAESRSYGGFGSTQATVMALKALISYSSTEQNKGVEGRIELLINNQPVLKQTYIKEESKLIHLKDLAQYFTDGKNLVQVKMLNEESKIPYSLDLSWKTKTPKSNNECKVDIRTDLNFAQVKEAETVRLHVELKNKTHEELPMTVALIGLPGGVAPQIWQLKEMQEKGVFDYYELRKNYLVLYYTSLKADEIKIINFDLKAEIPGTYQAPASCAYLYYNNEYKTWIDGEKAGIE